MAIDIQDLLLKVNRPSRYIGNEINAVKKDYSRIELSIALAFPDVYEVGMSHQGLKILYHILNEFDWIAAERVYAPWVDMEEVMRKNGIRLSTLESNRDLMDFDIIGFSLQHELSYSNVLNMLNLSGIPFNSAERKGYPLIIAGGPACFNPEPVADFFDLILIGDGEEATLQICKTVREGKSHNAAKEEILHELRKIRGVYIPSFFRPHYRPDGSFSHMEPLVGGYEVVRKAIVPDIGGYPFPSDQVVPFAPLVHDRLAIEISRGCTRGCRFCQAGMIYRPVRERDPDAVIEKIEEALRFTGFEELSLLSLSSGDYSCIAPLIKELMDRHSNDKVAVSLPSLRIDSIDPFWFEQIKRVRKTGFTMAPEAGNDRLRRIINKSLTNEGILNMARDMYKAGWNLIKLYFMIGLPFEEEQDVLDIIKLARQVADGSKRKGNKNVLNISVSTFVPKAHTPFMWESQIRYDESRRKIDIIRDAFKGRAIKVKWNQPELSWLEGIFSRGDRRLSKVLIEAWKTGVRFDAWGEHFRMDIWSDAFARLGIDPEFYLYRERSFDEVLPWDHIDSTVSKEYLIKERQKAAEAVITPDCREGCLNCGVCDHKKVRKIISNRLPQPIAISESSALSLEEKDKKKYRLIFSKVGPARFLSHLELARSMIRAFKRAGLNIVFSRGYHPMPRVSFVYALPVGIESDHESMDVEIYNDISITTLKEKINQQLPEGIKIKDIDDITLLKTGPCLIESHYKILLDGLILDKACLDNYMASDSFIVSKKTKKGERKIDVKTLTKSIKFISNDVIELKIIHRQGPEITPVRIIEEIFKIEASDMDRIKILKAGQVLG